MLAKNRKMKGKTARRGNKKSAITSRPDGAIQKSTSYDYAGVSASLGVKASDSQAITSALMPAAEPKPRKPTTEEFKATIKKQTKEIETLGRKVKLSEKATAKLKQMVERKSKQIKDLSDQLKEEKRSYRTSARIMDAIEKNTDKAALKLRLFLSDLAAAKEIANETIEREREDYASRR